MRTQELTSAASGWTDPRISQRLMTATYVIGGLGYFIGFSRMGSGGAESAITPVALLSVGVVGVVSMIRHSVFHRSDAVRMGWDLGRRNNFQIETGFANLAIGLPAVAAVVLGWGVVAEAAVVLAYALYFAQVTILAAIDRVDHRLDVRRVVTMALQSAFLGYFGLAGLRAAGVEPF